MTTTAVISLVVATSSEGEGHGYTGERNDIQSTAKILLLIFTEQFCKRSVVVSACSNCSDG